MKNEPKKILEVSHLKTYFKVGTGKSKFKNKAVDDISFDVRNGEVLGLVGESGCGKTTTARTIVRLYRPTDGTIKFEDEIIGSGHNEFYKLLKYEKIDYEKKKLQLNSRKYTIFQIKQKYKEKIAEIEKEIAHINKEFNKNVHIINADKEEYEKALFQIKVDYSAAKDIAHVNYVNKKRDLYNQTINEYQFELEEALKTTKKILKQKLSGIKASAGLDKEGKSAQAKIAHEVYLKEVQDLNTNYAPKIEERSKNILSKDDYNTQLTALKSSYQEIRLKNETERDQKINALVLPKQAENDSNILAHKEKLALDVNTLEEKIDKLKSEMKTEIAVVQKETTINYEELKKLKEEHKKFVAIQREKIKQSKQNHYTENAEKVYQKIQMIYQDPISSLNPRMTVQEIVSEGLIIQGIKDKEILKTRVAETLRLVGLPADFASRYPHEFSGGQRQRIGIARALIMNPKFIIADEPISALDVSIRAQVINLLTELKEKLGLTILFVAHDLSVVRFFCDRIVVMHGGKIVEKGDTEEIFNNPLHPYTKALLSAIPQPDPDFEKSRKRLIYNPFMHNYASDKPSLREIKENHHVFVNDEEFKLLKKEIAK